MIKYNLFLVILLAACLSLCLGSPDDDDAFSSHDKRLKSQRRPQGTPEFYEKAKRIRQDIVNAGITKDSKIQDLNDKVSPIIIHKYQNEKNLSRVVNKFLLELGISKEVVEQAKFHRHLMNQKLRKRVRPSRKRNSTTQSMLVMNLPDKRREKLLKAKTSRKRRTTTSHEYSSELQRQEAFQRSRERDYLDLVNRIKDAGLEKETDAKAFLARRNELSGHMSKKLFHANVLRYLKSVKEKTDNDIDDGYTILKKDWQKMQKQRINRAYYEKQSTRRQKSNSISSLLGTTLPITASSIATDGDSALSLSIDASNEHNKSSPSYSVRRRKKPRIVYSSDEDDIINTSKDEERIADVKKEPEKIFNLRPRQRKNYVVDFSDEEGEDVLNKHTMLSGEGDGRKSIFITPEMSTESRTLQHSPTGSLSQEEDVRLVVDSNIEDILREYGFPVIENHTSEHVSTSPTNGNKYKVHVAKPSFRRPRQAKKQFTGGSTTFSALKSV